MNQSDQQFIARALQLAERGLYSADPNPRVGCVLVKEGGIIGEGWHQWAGDGHAEINALADAKTRNLNPQGAVVYLSLEPCCFEGKTGPCTQALIAAGVSRVVYGMEDPNPRVAGQGLAQLKAAGIIVSGPLMEENARDLNPGFIKRMETGLPFVRIKMAMSLDGRTAMASGESKWITSAPARVDVQKLRARSSAVVTGIGTVQYDNPELSVRPEELGIVGERVRQPLRVVVDSQWQLPDNARILQAEGKVLQAGIAPSPSPTLIQNDKCESVVIESKNGRVDLLYLLQHLATLNCNEVLVEAGAGLAGQFLQQALVDEIVIYVAPKLLGNKARPLFELPLDSMAAQLGMRIREIRAVGQDWRVRATVDPEA